MNAPAVAQTIQSATQRARPHHPVTRHAQRRNKILHIQSVAAHPVKPAGFAHEQPAALQADIDFAARIQRQRRGRTAGQPLPRPQDVHGLGTQLHQAATGRAEPEIPLAILADGPDVIRPAALTQDHRLETVVFKTKQSPAAGADPDAPVPAFAQTPDAHRGRFRTAEIIEAFSLGQVDQVGVAEGPQISLPVLVSAEVFRAASLALRLKGVRGDVSVDDPAHSIPRGDPHRSGSRHIHPGNQFIRQAVLLGEGLKMLSGPKVQSGLAADPNLTMAVGCETRHRVIQESVRLGVMLQSALGQLKQSVLLGADPQMAVAVFAQG